MIRKSLAKYKTPAPRVDQRRWGDKPGGHVAQQCHAESLICASFSSTVQQVHIHIGATKISGGIVIFLCTNLSNGPGGYTHMPRRQHQLGDGDAHRDGRRMWFGPTTNQGIGVGDMKNVARAIGSHVADANVYTGNYPAEGNPCADPPARE